MKGIEVAMQRAALFELAVLLIVLGLTIWISYEVLKRAIRDGIKEAIDRRTFEPSRTTFAAPGQPPEGMQWALVPKPADAKSPINDFSATS